MLQSNQLQDAFTSLRKLRPANISFSSPITATDGTLVSDKQGKLRCWKEFYEGMLNRQPINLPEALREAASEATPTPSIPVTPPTTDEVHKAVSQLRSRRAPGICGITAELLKAGGTCCTKWLTNIIHKAWDTGSAHDDWKKWIILPFYKGKGSGTDCQNYRGITLFSEPGKVDDICQPLSVMCYLTGSKHTISTVPNRVVLHLTDQPSIILLPSTWFYRQEVNTENHHGWRTSIFDQFLPLNRLPCYGALEAIVTLLLLLFRLCSQTVLVVLWLLLRSKGIPQKILYLTLFQWWISALLLCFVRVPVHVFLNIIYFYYFHFWLLFISQSVCFCACFLFFFSF